ncbi:hypothetical protein VOLCADRAFT_101280 [Volvox carteri f. nagariensis]|uniref:Uncharacterized protein n=1 Tax=Volvox carteri f. nagariensis TaxID=3068 RepID=D8UM75_VOLCA|nr:uncharacterized protein VOLCADRAFT_101280 [Volvox carteri f. nagariensis]EFJ39173.1 hypothetical protein VOLCADRAFT_101280 [Volvox carteri f. nagariensis]|eukprot:XP_002959761.1 hypothetical protein VOLCADRAFT_101280 [Volvox carteri f. nagariensis]
MPRYQFPGLERHACARARVVTVGAVNDVGAWPWVSTRLLLQGWLHTATGTVAAHATGAAAANNNVDRTLCTGRFLAQCCVTLTHARCCANTGNGQSIYSGATLCLFKGSLRHSNSGRGATVHTMTICSQS